MQQRVKFPNVANLRQFDVDDMESKFDRNDQKVRAANQINIWMRLSNQWGGLDTVTKEHK